MSFKSKPVYRQMGISDLQPNRGDEVWSSKIDGAHAIVQMEKGKLPRLFSHRISKRTNEPIEYTLKLPHISKKSPIDATFRAEVFAVDAQGKAVHPDVVTAMLNSGLDKSLDLQKRMGITTKTALINVDTVNGTDVSVAPYAKKLKFMKEVVRRNPNFILPDLAHTKEEKEKMLSHIVAGTHPLTKEGIVVHSLNDFNKPFTKAKIVAHHDVVVRGIFHEEGTKKGRNPMAGGFEYSWTHDGPIVGRVGTGFDHSMKKDMLTNPHNYVGRTAKVKALDLSKNRVLVKPSFDGWHVEKNLTDSEEKTAYEVTNLYNEKHSANGGMCMHQAFTRGFEKRANARSEKAKEDLAKGGLLAAGGGAAVYSAKDPVIGRYTVYHGTKPENVSEILKEGLKAKMGGKGVSSSFRSHLGPANKDWAHGKVYFTGSEALAKEHTGTMKPGFFGAQASGQNPKGVVEMSLPHHMWDKAKADPEYASIIGKGDPFIRSQTHEDFSKSMKSTVKEVGDNPILKRIAAYYEGDIDPKYIRGGKDFWKTQFRELKHLPEYIKSNPLRFGLGVGLLGGGSYGVYRGGKQVITSAKQLRESGKT